MSPAPAGPLWGVAPASDLALLAVAAFVALLLLPIARHPGMFAGRYGRRHRLIGLSLLCWLVLGFVDAAVGPLLDRLVYDSMLGALGIATTLTAAMDFQRAHDRTVVKNVASGALDVEATVTVDEMVEHSFYQVRPCMPAVAPLHTGGSAPHARGSFF